MAKDTLLQFSDILTVFNLVYINLITILNILARFHGKLLTGLAVNPSKLKITSHQPMHGEDHDWRVLEFGIFSAH